MTATSNATEAILHNATLESWQDDEAGDVQEVGRWYALFRGQFDKGAIRDCLQGCEYTLERDEYRALRTMAGAIYQVDGQGFMDVEIYSDESALNEAWDRIFSEVEEASGPSEDDLVTEDHTHVYQSGRLVLETSPDTFESDVAAYMERSKYWPNVWFISDHGNAHLLTIEVSA